MRAATESRIVFGPLSELSRDVDAKKAFIVTEPGIRRLYGSSFPPCAVVETREGEAAKSLASLEDLYGCFLDLGLERGSSLLAIGGGAVSDLAGFAAATWMRGVDFGFVPTTLLAMVDASIGGKNGIDFRGRKNLIGTFAPPRFVRFDVSLLATLPAEQFASGMAEVIKHAVIAGGEYFELVERCGRDGRDGLDAPALERMVRGSIEIKSAIVARDEREGGERRKLNLGHTIGHALETATGIPHGHAVAAGLACACAFSVSRGSMPAEAARRIEGALSAWGLPRSLGEAALPGAAPSGGAQSGAMGGMELREAIALALGVDKKRAGDDMLFALPREIGKVEIAPIPVAVLRDFVRGAA